MNALSVNPRWATESFNAIMLGAESKWSASWASWIASVLLGEEETRGFERVVVATEDVLAAAAVLGDWRATCEASAAGASWPATTQSFASNGSGAPVLGVGAFEAAVRMMGDKTPRTSQQIEAIRRAAAGLAARLAGRTAAPMRERLISLRERLLAEQEGAFWIKGATVEQAAIAKRMLTGYLRSQGRPFRKDPLLPSPPSDLEKFVRGMARAGLATTKAHLNTVYRTNMNRAQSQAHAAALAGRDVRAVLPMVRLFEIHDRRTRGAPGGVYSDGAKNPGWHWQMDGLIETVDFFARHGLIPPNGYRCRGSLIGVSWTELGSLGLLNADGSLNRTALNTYNRSRLAIIAAGRYPDPGFKEAA